MELSVEEEYKMVHAEIVEIRTCINTYVNMFFTVGAAVIGGILYITTKDGTIDKLAKISEDPMILKEIAYVPLIFAYIVVAFTTILFHKFNTHNRGCGYMRALELERHIGRQNQSATLATSFVDRAWQSVLAVPFQKPNFQWGRVRSDVHFELLQDKFLDLDRNCAHPFRNVTRWISRGLQGWWMIFRSTISRADTRSWTFPFQVAFGPFVITAIIGATWCALIYKAGVHSWDQLFLGVQMKLQLVLVCHLILCWVGLGYRMYRLCANHGDRTIEAWFWRTVVLRHQAFKAENIIVEYVGWFPKSTSDRLP